jgi:ElaB/YqjD/DUF883 family membrane-anchored ribosome-binding protein
MTQQSADYPLDYTKGPHQPASDRLHETSDAAADRAKSATARAQEIGGKVTQQARDFGDKIEQAACNFKPLVATSMNEQPMGTLAAAAVIGFVLGALWKK